MNKKKNCQKTAKAAPLFSGGAAFHDCDPNGSAVMFSCGIFSKEDSVIIMFDDLI